MNWVPLSDLRYDLLVSAERTMEVPWASAQLLAWGRSSLAVTCTMRRYPGAWTVELTPIGREMLAMHRAHTFRISSFLLGGSPIKGMPARRGTRLTCRCGFTTKSNESRSATGATVVRNEYRRHLSEVELGKTG